MTKPALSTACGKTGLLLSFFLALLVSRDVPAQEPATAFDQLNLIVKEGDKVTVTGPSGDRITGRVNSLASNGLELKTGAGVRSFSDNDIRQITRKKPDSPLNGFLIGFAAGFGATLPVNLGIADDDETGMALAASAIWGLIGGGIGALVDACVQEKQLVYQRPNRSFSWGIRPFYSHETWPALSPDSPPFAQPQSAKGLRLTIRF